MSRALRCWLIAMLGIACSSPEAGEPDASIGHDAGTDMGIDADRDAAADAGAAMSLEVRGLGVQGFVLSYRGESVMTAPLFTRQSTVEIGLNLPITADTAAIDTGLADVRISDIRAVITGHAHYDHLLDVVHVLALAPSAIFYGNRSAAHIFAAYAPDRDVSCTGAPHLPPIVRTQVVALDDPLASHVDYTNCPDQLPPGAPMDGSWVMVPGSHIRLMPVCTTHPAQIGPIHFGPGGVDTDLCDPPAPAAGWLEGQTLSYVIDFLGDDGRPAFRVYYQDAPATRPIGEVPPSILADHRVDLAILCVGSNDAVMNQPTDIIANVDPRFVFSGHWEDFFRPLDRPIMPLPLLNVTQYVMRAETALPAPPDAPLLVDGAPVAGRHVLIMPGMHLVVPAAR